MNKLDALYAVTRLNWHELHQPKNSLALFLFRQCRGFHFPQLDTPNIVFPSLAGENLNASLLKYIFGPNVALWSECVPPEWYHYIEAVLFAMKKKKICLCCSSQIEHYGKFSN